MAETKAAFRRRVGRLLHTYHTGTTTAGTASTTVGFVLPWVDIFPGDDVIVGQFVYDTAAFESRRVSAWNSTTGRYTVSRAFTNSQDSGRTIEIFEQFSPQDIDDALQQALDEVYPYIVSRVVDTSLTVIAEQYEYTVPTTIRDLERLRGGRVQWQVNSGVSTFPYDDFEHWEVRESGGASKTLLLHNIAGRVGRTIRLIGWGNLTFPATDTTSIDLEPDTLQLLAFKVAEICWRTGPSLTGRDADVADRNSARWAALYMANRDSWGVRMAPTTLESPLGAPYVEPPLAYYHADPA